MQVMRYEFVRVWKVGVAALCVCDTVSVQVMCDGYVRVWRAGVAAVCVSVW